jgi:hypothetical protein
VIRPKAYARTAKWHYLPSTRLSNCHVVRLPTSTLNGRTGSFHSTTYPAILASGLRPAKVSDPVHAGAAQSKAHALQRTRFGAALLTAEQ